MFNQRRSSVLATLSLAALLAACADEGAAPAGAAGGGGAQEVTVATLQSAPLSLTRELPGRVSPSLVAEVRPQVTGIVKQRLFTEGGTVKAGQALYQLDDATYRANAHSARASLARAQATLKAAQLTATRSDELARIEAVSTQEHERATAALLQAQAEVEVAKAAVASNEVVLEHARITSPIGGRIGRSSVTQGALVTAAQSAPLATVQQLDPVYVDLTQSSSELLQMRKELASGKLQQSNVPVTIVLEDGTEYQHRGKLAFSEVSVDPSTGSFALRVAVANPDSVLLPGSYVRAVIGSGQRVDAVLVPQRGVARDPKGNTSAMVVRDGKVEVQPVQVSRTIGDQWLVESGLVAGDQVIVEGLQKIRPGMPVKAVSLSVPDPAAPAAAASAAVASTAASK